MKILVIKFRHIGDVLLTTPLISVLKNHYKNAEITVLVKAGTEDMLTGNPDIHDVIALPKRDKNTTIVQHITYLFQLLRQLRKQKFDLAINTTEGDRGIIISFLAGAKKRLGFLHDETTKKEKFWRKSLLTDSVIWEKNNHHTVLQNIDVVADLIGDNHPDTDISATLVYETSLKDNVKRMLTEKGWCDSQPLVHIHPVSRWFFKCWQDEKMASTIDFIQSHLQAQVVLSCGPDRKETNKLKDIIKRCETHPIDLGGQLTLKELAALSDLADLFFGVDSAPMHMAAAVNTPVIALFGPSSVQSWGPWDNGRSVSLDTPYQGNGVQQASPHTVLQQNWSCVPCGKAGCNNSKVSDCLVELPEHWVKEQLQTKLLQLKLLKLKL